MFGKGFIKIKGLLARMILEGEWRVFAGKTECQRLIICHIRVAVDMLVMQRTQLLLLKPAAKPCTLRSRQYAFDSCRLVFATCRCLTAMMDGWRTSGGFGSRRRSAAPTRRSTVRRLSYMTNLLLQ